MKTEPIHLDVLGRQIKLGDLVAAAIHNGLHPCKVTKFGQKQIRVVPIKQGRYGDSGYLKYGNQTAILDGPDVTMWLLKQ